MRIRIIASGSAALAVFIIYALTSAPGIGLVDSGELTVVAQTLSIAHPTGYPLYALLGRVWLFLSRMEPARGMVLFSCMMAAVAAGLISWIILFWQNNATSRSPASIIAFAAATAIGFALTQTAWTAIRYAEVYPLTYLLGALLLALTAMHASNLKHGPSVAILIAYLWGLGFGNHLTILWFFPVVLYTAVRTLRKSAEPRKYALLFVAAVAAGASVNLFLPIRSSVEPPLDWSDPQTIPNLIRHLTAWQYRVWMFKGGGAQFIHKLGSYLLSVPSDIGWGAIAAAVLGLWFAIKRRFGFVWAALLTWVIGVFYNLNYDIPDIATYFLALYCPLFVVGVYGLVEIAQQIQARLKNSVMQFVGLLGIAVLIPLSALPSSLSAVKEGDNRFAERFTREVLHTLPDSALVMQAHWDIQSPAIYLQKIRHVRPDVVMLDINLMQRSWYVKQERRAHPDVFNGLDCEIGQFLKEVAVFEARKPFDGKRIETAYLALMNGIIEKNMKHRPVYVRDMQASRHPGIAASFSKSPGAFFLRISEASEQNFILNPDNILTENSRYNDREKNLLHEAALSACLQGKQAMTDGNLKLVQQTLTTSRKLAPTDLTVQQYEEAAREFQASSSAMAKP
jgi:hypothetical protein